ncbi:MAG: hypothetical protein ACKOFC_06125 [Solirubrobacterales bacterium]
MADHVGVGEVDDREARALLAGVRRLYLDLLTAEQQEQLGAAWEKIDTADETGPEGCGR